MGLGPSRNQDILQPVMTSPVPNQEFDSAPKSLSNPAQTGVLGRPSPEGRKDRTIHLFKLAPQSRCQILLKQVFWPKRTQH